MGVPLASTVAPARMALESPFNWDKQSSPCSSSNDNSAGVFLKKRLTLSQCPMSWASSTPNVMVVSAINQSKSLNLMATRPFAAATLSMFHPARTCMASSTSTRALSRSLKLWSPGWEQLASRNKPTKAHRPAKAWLRGKDFIMRRCAQTRQTAQGPWG